MSTTGSLFLAKQLAGRREPERLLFLRHENRELILSSGSKGLGDVGVVGAYGGYHRLQVRPRSPCVSGLDTLADDLVLLANVHVDHEGDDVVTLVTLEENDLIAVFAFDDGSVASEVLPHVLQDLFEIELRIQPFHQRCALASVTLLDRHRDA